MGKPFESQQLIKYCQTTVHLGQFINIDIYRKGTYQLVLTLKTSHNKFKTNISIASQQSGWNFRQTKCYSSAFFQIDTHDQEVNLNEVAIFRTGIEIPRIKQFARGGLEFRKGFKCTIKASLLFFGNKEQTRKLVISSTYFNLFNPRLEPVYTSVRFDGVNYSHFDMSLWFTECGYSIVEKSDDVEVSEVSQKNPQYYPGSTDVGEANNSKGWMETLTVTKMFTPSKGANVDSETSSVVSGRSVNMVSDTESFSSTISSKNESIEIGDSDRKSILVLLLNNHLKFLSNQIAKVHTCKSDIFTSERKHILSDVANPAILYFLNQLPSFGSEQGFSGGIETLKSALAIEIAESPSAIESYSKVRAQVQSLCMALWISFAVNYDYSSKLPNVRLSWLNFVKYQYSKPYTDQEKPQIFEQVLSTDFNSIYSKDRVLGARLNIPELPAEFLANSTMPFSLAKETVNLVVYVHGFLGTKYDLRNYRNQVKYFDLFAPTDSPGKIVHFISEVNEEKTKICDIETMGENLATEIRAYIKQKIPEDTDVKLSFVCHSMGGLIARFATTLLGEYEMEGYLSLSTPHTSLLNSQNLIFDSGLSLYRAWTACPALDELMLVKDTLLRLTQKRSFGRFKRVFLVGSSQDGYSPMESALLTYPEGKTDTSSGIVEDIQAALIEELFTCDCQIFRADVEFGTKNKESISRSRPTSAWSFSGTIDSITGRAAHIGLIEDHQLTDTLVLLNHLKS